MKSRGLIKASTASSIRLRARADLLTSAAKMLVGPGAFGVLLAGTAKVIGENNAPLEGIITIWALAALGITSVIVGVIINEGAIKMLEKLPD